MKSLSFKTLGLLALSLSTSFSAVVITAPGETYSENFNYGTFTPAVPTNWARSGAAGVTTLTYGTPGADTVVNTNGYYLLRPNAGSTNYAYAEKVAAAAGSPADLTLQVTNQSINPLAGFNLSWDAIQYTSGNRASAMRFSYSLDNVSFITAGLSFSSGSDVFTASNLTGINSGAGSNVFRSTSVGLLSTIAELNLATPLGVGQSIYFRFEWGTGAGGGNNAIMGFDNFSLTAVPEPTTAGLVLTGIGLIWLRRRLRA